MLENIITSKTRLRLLVKFFINVANEGYLRGLATEMQESTNSIRKELNNLTEAGYLIRTEENLKVTYKANQTNPFFKLLQQIVRKYVHIGIDGRRYHCFHGDILDFVIMEARWLAIIGGYSYDVVIRLNTLYNKIRKWFNLPYHSLANTIKQSVKSAINFVSDFEENARGLTKERGYDVAVCGHIHQPKLENDYMNSGDFCENASCLVEDYDGTWSIVNV